MSEMTSDFMMESIVIKEELVIKEEPPLTYEPDDVEGEMITDDPLTTAADIKPEPVDPMEAVSCGDTFWDENQHEEFADDSNSQGSILYAELSAKPADKQQPVFCCKFCPKKYKRLGAFTAHTKTHTTSTVVPKKSLPKENSNTLRCPLCMFGTHTYKEMLSHHRTKHPDASQQREFLETKARETGANAGPTAPEGTFQCGVCFRKLEDLPSFFSHRKLHEQSVCEECGKMTTFNSVFHKLTHLGKALHPCLYCDKYFSQKSTLAMHEKLHSNEKIHECDLCHETFLWFYQLIDHEKVHSKDTSDVLDMVKKIRAAYSPNKHRCKKCGQSFKGIVEYCKHMVSHDGEEEERILNLKCHICDQSFNDVVLLLNHRKCHR